MQKNTEQKPRKKSSSKRKQSPRQPSSDKRDIYNKMRNKKQVKQATQAQKSKGLTTKVDKYQVEHQSIIGRGTFGLVLKAHLIDRPDQVFACKFISNSKIEKQQFYKQNNPGKSMIDRLKQQIQTQKQLSQCKYVVKLYDFVHMPDNGYYLFMEMCDVDLGKFIKQRDFLPQAESLDFFKQLLRGYKHLYQHGISHRDLKPENLLLSGKNLKISDFGFVKVHTAAELILRSAQKGMGLAQSLVGSINYIAPDIIIAESTNGKYNPFESDVWSMGIILYKMLFGKQPYQSADVKQLQTKIQTLPLQIPQKPQISQQTANLLKKMIQKDPSKRIAFKQICRELLTVEENNVKQESKGTSSVIYSEKERLLLFYNLLITKISYDCAHHATLREIGIGQYQKYSYRLMSLIHEKRLHILKTSSRQLKPQIKKQIQNYDQIFYKAIKQSSTSTSSTISQQHQSKSITKTDLSTQLTILVDLLKQYNQLEMLHKDVQYFILLLLLLSNSQRGFVSNDYIFTVIDKEKNNKMNLKKLEELTKKNLQYNK